MKLLRMISSLERWDGRRDVQRPNPSICGDAIADLRTKNNCLSTWIADTDVDKDTAVVALALGRDKADKLCYVILDDQDLKNLEIDISDECKGEAKGLNEDLLTNHRDLIEMDYEHIGKLANYITPLVRSGQFKVITKAQVKSLLETYKGNELIDIEKVNDSLKIDLNWE